MGLASVSGFISTLFFSGIVLFLGGNLFTSEHSTFTPCKTRLQASCVLKLRAHFAIC